MRSVLINPQQIDLLGRLNVAFDLMKGKGAGMRVQPIGVRRGLRAA